jgi:4-methylaminobutanoate oxidase (formaldehyde-forming)
MGVVFPRHASVVVIGGGIIGCSTAYHLAKLGRKDVVLLERSKLTSGTTWHSAAMVRQLRSTVSLTQLTRYSVQLYSSLAAETGQETGWRQCGSLSIATNEDRMTHIRRQASLARAFDIDAHEVSRDKVQEFWPIAELDDVVGGVWSPLDGRVNPTDTCAALVKGATRSGARIFEDTVVNSFTVTNGRVTGVKTTRGDMTCEAVVLCAGLWSRAIAKLVNVAVPLHGCEHYAMITKTVPGVTAKMPILGDHDNHIYIREEVGGLLIGCFEPNARPVGIEQLPANFSFDLLNEDWDHFEPIMMSAMRRIPALEKVEVRKLINGPESFTPDDRFMIGEAPNLRGFYVGCGMNSVGMASGGGAGRALAEWIVEGEPTMDLWAVDVRRYGRFWSNLKTVRERAAESLSLHYAIGYPGRERKTGRMLRLSPFYERQRRNGAYFEERGGWERPSWFSPPGQTVEPELTFARPKWFDCIAREHLAGRNAVAMFDRTSLGKILVQGRDAEAFLQRIITGDISRADRRAVYTLMLNARGGCESDVVVLKIAPDSFLMTTGTSQIIKDMDWLRRHVGGDEQVAIVDVTSAYAVLSLIGPGSRDLLAGVSPDDFSDAGFPPFAHREIEIGKSLALAARVSYGGGLGWELIISTELALPIYDTLVEAGAASGLVEGGAQALNTMRLEQGFCVWGHDIGPDDNPIDAGLEFLVKFDKPVEFIGAKALSLLKGKPGRARRVSVTVDDPNVILLGSEPILRGDRLIGRTTSAGYGHSLGRAVAQAYLQTDGRPEELDQLVVEIEVACRRFNGRVHLRGPFAGMGKGGSGIRPPHREIMPHAVESLDVSNCLATAARNDEGQ